MGTAKGDGHGESWKRKREQQNTAAGKEGLGGGVNGSNRTITNQEMRSEFSFCM